MPSLRSLRVARRSLLLCAALVAMAHPVPAAAQGTALVAGSDLAYADVDRCVELGLLDGVIVGQQPYSLREFARIVRVMRERLDARGGARNYVLGDRERAANGILQRLERRFGDEAEPTLMRPAVSLVDAGAVTFQSTDATSRGFPGNEASQTEATIEPLTYRRLGRRAPPGSSLGLTLEQRVEPLPWLAFRARERFEYRLPNDTLRPRHDEELLLGSMRARFGNTALTVGREQFAWAQREGTGLFLASDAPALDQVSLASESPFYLPGLLGRLGPTAGTLFVADLGASTVRSHSRLLGYKVSVQPDPSVEFGGSFFNHFGGTGSPPASFGARLVDFLPFIDVFRRHNYSDSTRALDVESDKVLGIDGRWRIARLNGLTLAGEMLVDDVDVHQITRMLTGYGSSWISMTLPSLGSPDWSLELTAKHMGILTYTHTQLTNGITTRGRLLGDELGPNAKALGAALRWRPSPAVTIEAEGRAAIYSDADYNAFYTDSAQSNYVVGKTADRGGELRDRVRASVVFQSDEGLALVVRGGGERVRNLDFQGMRRNEYLLDVALRLRM